MHRLIQVIWYLIVLVTHRIGIGGISFIVKGIKLPVFAFAYLGHRLIQEVLSSVPILVSRRSVHVGPPRFG